MREWRIDLPIDRPLSLNHRQHWAVKASAVKGVRTAVHVLARRQRIPALGRFTVELHYAPRFNRRQDPENLFATVKPATDGLIDAGVAPDDCPPYYVSTTPIVHPATGKSEGRLWIVVRELPEETDDAA